MLRFFNLLPVDLTMFIQVFFCFVRQMHFVHSFRIISLFFSCACHDRVKSENKEEKKKMKRCKRSLDALVMCVRCHNHFFHPFLGR
jgi:hypothetical protein